ncbi:MAG: hypothetical protein H6R10_2002 [Rhodocyclaceae bacterium]|nr:hypothetical protein [Rhodocyclaceae bacterium]
MPSLDVLLFEDIAQRIKQHHSGRIRAETFPDEGATFFLTLPLRDAAVDV